MDIYENQRLFRMDLQVCRNLGHQKTNYILSTSCLIEKETVKKIKTRKKKENFRGKNFEG